MQTEFNSTNVFRLTLHGPAYNLANLFREIGLAKTEVAHAQIDTLRFELFKIGAWVKESVRRIWIKQVYTSFFLSPYLWGVTPIFVFRRIALHNVPCRT